MILYLFSTGTPEASKWRLAGPVKRLQIVVSMEKATPIVKEAYILWGERLMLVYHENIPHEFPEEYGNPLVLYRQV